MSENATNEEKQILARVANDDERAFRAIYQRYAGKVYGMALQYLKSAFYAQDMVQDVFSKVWQQRTSLAALDSFDRWLTTVTKNQLINQLQKAVRSDVSRQLHPAASADAKDPVASHMDYRELETLLNLAVQQLPSRQKEVYELSRNSGLSHREIAGQLGISYDMTREHMSKALKNIRMLLEKQYGPLGLIVCLVYGI